MIVNRTTDFDDWLKSLDINAKARVLARVIRLEETDNFGDVRVLKGCTFDEMRFKGRGPGLRIYFMREEDEVVLLIGGSIKRNQKSTIATLKAKYPP